MFEIKTFKSSCIYKGIVKIRCRPSRDAATGGGGGGGGGNSEKTYTFISG